MSTSRRMLAMQRAWGAALVSTALLFPARAQAPAAKPVAAAPAPAVQPPQRVTSVEGLTEYRLANGLRVLLFPDPSKPTITVNVTYLVGSRLEQYGETGMAHLLEHMMFKGSPRHRDIPQELTQHGARPNGETSFDRTNYYETFEASETNLNWALDLESDRMLNSFVAKKDLDSEMTVVRNEFESGENDPRSVLEERTLSTAYLWHNYGHSTIGARADIENVPIERLQAFYRKHYQPDNAVLLIAGRFEEPSVLIKVQKYFGTIPRPKRTLMATYTIEPTQDGERSVTLRRSGDVQGLCAVYHIPSGSHEDAAPIELLADILADTPSGRLHKALVETKKASEIWGFPYALREPGTIVFGAQVRQDSSLEEARETLIRTIETFAQTPATAEEVERARTSYLKSVDLTLSHSDRLGLVLSEFIGMGDWRLFFLERDRVKKVTPADVTRVAATYLKASNRTVGSFIPTSQPDRAEIPLPPDVASLVKDYRGETALAAAEAFDPSPANVEARTQRSTLTSGAKLALLPKKTRGATVVATLTFRFGDEQSLTGRSTAADFAVAMLMRGSARHTRQQIQDDFDRLKARVNLSGGATQVAASLETVESNLEPALRLLAEVLKEPAFPANEFDTLKQEQLSALEEQRSDPEAQAFNAFNRRLGPYPKGHVRYTPSLDEEKSDTEAARLEDAQGFYREYFGGSNAELALVGDFDAARASAVLEELFGAWKSPRAYERVKSRNFDVAPDKLWLETPDKANAVFIAGQNLALRDDDPDYPALVMGNFMLGGGFLNSRLAVRIRQKEGLSYGVGSQLNANPLDPAGEFMAYAILAPENMSRVEKAFGEELAHVLADGFTADELKAALSGWLQSRQVSRAQDGALAGKLATYLFLGRTLAWDRDLEQKVAALTPEQIRDAMRRHIDAAKLVLVEAGDFAGAAKRSPKP